MQTALRYGKSGLTWTIVVSVVAWTMGLAALLTPLTVAQALTSGDLIKASQAAVYYFGADGKRYVFPNEKTYKTWYSDFSGVVVITDSELAAVPIGGNATYKPGVKMVKITTDPKVYAVDSGGTLRPIDSEATATALYGANWNQMIDDVPDPFFVNYTVGSEVTDASQFDKAAVEAAATSINDDKNLSAGGVSGGGSLSVSLAADTPPAGLAVENAARLAFTKIILTNNTSLDAVVDSAKVELTGLAARASFSSVEILDGNTKKPLNKNTRTLNSDDEAIFNDDFTVPANGSLPILLVGNMAANNDARAGEQAILALKEIVLKGGGTVSGTLPVAGNAFTINATLVIGTATIVPGGNEPAASTKEVGTTDYTVTSFKVTAGSGEDVTIKSVTLTQNGSASPGDVQNVEIVDANTSVVVCTFANPTTDKITCDLNQDLDKGKNKTYDVRLDIANGSARTISYDIDKQADLTVTGRLYGYDVLPTYQRPSGTGTSATPYHDAVNTTIGDGTLRIESVSVTPTNISEGLDQTVLGMFNFDARGEPMNVETIGWDFQITTGTGSSGVFTDITNVTVYDENGSVVAGPLDPTGSGHASSCGSGACGATATSTDFFTVEPGVHKYTVKADLSTDFASNDTIQVRVHAAAATVKGDITDNTVTPTPTGATSGTTLTIKAATLSVTNSASPAAQTVVGGANQYLTANFVLDATQSGDDLRITSIAIGHKHTGASFPNVLSGWKVFDGTTAVPINSESTTCSGDTCNDTGNATTTLTIVSGDLTVTKGTSKTLEIRPNVGTGATSGTFAVYCGDGGGCITAIDSDAQTITNTYTNDDGQTMTLATGGTLNVSLLTDPVSDLVVGNSTVEVGRFTMKSKNEGVSFNFFGLQIASPDGGIVGNQDEIESLTIEQVGGSSWSVPVSANRATITPAGLSQTIDEEKTYVVKVKFNTISDSSPAQSGAGIRVNLSNLDVTGSSAGSTSVTVNGLGNNFSTFSLFKAIPTLAKVSFSGSDNITSNDIFNLFKVSVSADASNPVGLFKLTFGVSTTTVTMNPSGWYLYESGSSSTLGDIIAQGSDITLAQAPEGGVTHLSVYLDINDDNSDSPAYEHRVLSAGSTKYYTFRGTVANGHSATVGDESIATVLAGDASFASTTNDDALGIDADGNTTDNDFIWSDLNADTYATSTATQTDMWFNGYRVPGMDNTSSTPQTITD